MVAQFADSPEFQRLLAGNDRVDLARVALEIGRDAYPDIDIEAYVERIDAPRGPGAAGSSRTQWSLKSSAR